MSHEGPVAIAKKKISPKHVAVYLATSKTKCLVWANHLQAKKALAGAAVSLVDGDFTTRTNDRGVALFDRPPRLSGKHPARYFLVTAAEGERLVVPVETNLHSAYYWRWGAEGDYEGAAAMFDRFAQITGTDPTAFHTYLAALRDPSQRPAAVEALQARGFYGAMQGSELLAHLGETDAALAALERAARERSPYLPWVNALPQFDTLRSDPRFQTILAWMNL